MSSAHLPRQDHSTRTWWSLASKNPSAPSSYKLDRSFPSEKPTNRNSSTKSASTGLKFNTLASAIGFKSKKHPSLAIQEPPSPIRPVNSVPDTPTSVPYSNRPTTRSDASTVRSWDDLNEPRTPSDRERMSYPQSLLTLSDADPFAARAIAMSHATQDPNRLSVFSNSSIPEPTPKKSERAPLFNRSSYASSSSLSHSHGDHSMEDLPLSPSTSSDGRRSSPHKSPRPDDRRRKQSNRMSPINSSRETMVTRTVTQHTLAKSGSSSTLTDKKRLSDPDTSRIHRIPMRARGMTDAGAWSSPSMPHFFRKAPASPKPTSTPPVPSIHSSHNNSPTRPRVVVRQPSSSRIALPPSAPPLHNLPPPPVPGDVGDEPNRPESSNCSGSSSNLSFASSMIPAKDKSSSGSARFGRSKENGPSSERDLSFPYRMDGDWERGLVFPLNTDESSLAIYAGAASRTLKKSSSHQTLGKKTFSSTASSVPPTPLIPATALDEAGSVKAPRKQRSFHQSRIPLPPLPLPLRHANSFGPSGDSPTPDSRRESTSSIPVRKRLFSGSSLRRPSTSQTTGEDDIRSVFSLPVDSDQGHHNLSLSNQLSHSESVGHSSFWDESTPEHVPSSPAMSTQDYVPQHIMSPAELREVERRFEDERMDLNDSRSRRVSLTSISTALSDRGGADSLPVKSKSPLMLAKHKERVANHQGSWQSGVPPRRSSLMADKGPTKVTRSPTSQVNASPPESPVNPSFQSSIARPAGLPPPPRPRIRPSPSARPTNDTRIPDRSSNVPIIPLSPPPRRAQRSQTVKDKGLQHRSIMRKPSFLEIDDDPERRFSKPLQSSFLELESTRGSLDTVHTIDEYDGHG